MKLRLFQKAIKRSKEKHEAELDYVIRTLFLRRDSDRLPIIFKGKRIRKVLDLFSLSTSGMQNLSCTLSSKEILNLDHFAINLIVFSENLLNV